MNRFDREIFQQEPSSKDLLNGHLRKLAVPSLESIAQSQGVELASFPMYFNQRVARTFQIIESASFASNNEWFSHFRFIYETWFATRSIPGREALPDFAESLNSHDNFMQALDHESSMQQLSAFNFWVKWFNDKVVHPEKILKVYPPNSDNYEITQRGIYGYSGTWHSIPSNDETSNFVAESVIKEISELSKKLFHSEANLFHATGSAALHGISQNEALLSARESERRGNPVKTGEYTQRDKHGHLPVGGTNGLENLYASTMIDCGYSTIRWFNEYPVIFGFKSSEIEKYLRSRYGWSSSDIRGVSADGHRLGEAIPLSLVRAIYTFYQYVDELRRWAEENIPKTQVISIEAATLLRTRSDQKTTLYPDYPYRFDDPVVPDWKALLDTPKIVLS